MKLVGMVTEDEKVAIQLNFQRKLALQCLFNSVSSNDKSHDLYEKIVADLGSVEFALQEWWAIKSKEYNWESSEKGSWNIDFETNEIYLSI